MTDHLAEAFASRGRPPRDRLPRDQPPCAPLPSGPNAGFLRRASAHCLRPRPAVVRPGLHRTVRALHLASALCRRSVKAGARLLKTFRTGALRLHHRAHLSLALRAGRGGPAAVLLAERRPVASPAAPPTVVDGV